MSDSYKKDITEVLEYFLPIYEIMTNDTLCIVEKSERPDFICKRKNGELIGVEIVQVKRGHPNDVFHYKVVNKNINLHPEKSIDIIQSVIYGKSRKRKENSWKLSAKTIHLVHLNRVSALGNFGRPD